MPDFGMVGLLNGGFFNFKSCINHFNNHLRSKIHDKASSKSFMTFTQPMFNILANFLLTFYLYLHISVHFNKLVVAFVLKNRMAPFGSIL